MMRTFMKNLIYHFDVFTQFGHLNDESRLCIKNNVKYDLTIYLINVCAQYQKYSCEQYQKYSCE